VSPAPAPGATALVESLSRYTEHRVLGAAHGETAVPPVLAFELDRYLAGHGGGDEPPLVAVEGEPHVYYAKGALVMAAVRDLLGEEATHAALARLVERARAGRQPTAADLLAELQRGAGERQRRLLDDWWRRVVVYDLAVRGAEATPGADGRLLLRVDVAAARRDEAAGRVAPLALDEEIGWAVYAADPGVAGNGGPPLQAGRWRVRGDGHFAASVDARARWVAVDPDLLRIDRNRADNVMAIRLRR
jgi:hypothetical protein